MKTLYDTDAFAWSEAQAAALRLLNARSTALGLDPERLASGIAAVGREMLDRGEHAARTVLKHAVAGYCDTDSPLVGLRRVETIAACRALRRELTPTLAARLDLDRLWGEAFDAAMREITPRVLGIPPSLPVGCPFTLDEVADPGFTYDRAVEQLYVRLTAYRPETFEDRCP